MTAPLMSSSRWPPAILTDSPSLQRRSVTNPGTTTGGSHGSGLVGVVMRRGSCMSSSVRNTLGGAACHVTGERKVTTGSSPVSFLFNLVQLKGAICNCVLTFTQEGVNGVFYCPQVALKWKQKRKQEESKKRRSDRSRGKTRATRRDRKSLVSLNHVRKSFLSLQPQHKHCATDAEGYLAASGRHPTGA